MIVGGHVRATKDLRGIDKVIRACLALPVPRKLKSEDVLAALAELSVTHGPPVHIRPDNGPEFIANAVTKSVAGREL